MYCAGISPYVPPNVPEEKSIPTRTLIFLLSFLPKIFTSVSLGLKTGISPLSDEIKRIPVGKLSDKTSNDFIAKSSLLEKIFFNSCSLIKIIPSPLMGSESKFPESISASNSVEFPWKLIEIVAVLIEILFPVLIKNGMETAIINKIIKQSSTGDMSAYITVPRRTYFPLKEKIPLIIPPLAAFITKKTAVVFITVFESVAGVAMEQIIIKTAICMNIWSRKLKLTKYKLKTE